MEINMLDITVNINDLMKYLLMNIILEIENYI